MDNKEILDYLKTQRVGVLAVEMLDGSPHGATVHFANSDNPLIFYFETNREYRKAEAILKKERVRASFVVGCDEKNMKTLQVDGIVELLKEKEEEIFDSVYLPKFPEKKEKLEDSKFVFFKFTPTWWRFTDWTSPRGKRIITSLDRNKDICG